MTTCLGTTCSLALESSSGLEPTSGSALGPSVVWVEPLLSCAQAAAHCGRDSEVPWEATGVGGSQWGWGGVQLYASSWRLYPHTPILLLTLQVLGSWEGRWVGKQNLGLAYRGTDLGTP